MVNNNDTITLPRNVVEEALEALTNCTSEYGHRCNRCHSEVDPEGNVASALRAALDQPQAVTNCHQSDQPQNHVQDAGNMIPVGWKLVPIEPTLEMIEAGKDAHCESAAELRRLNNVDQCLNEWLDKTQWVQTSAQSHELGMHRADVISQRFAEITKQRDELLVALKWMIDVTDEGGFPSRMCLQKARAVLDKATGDTK